MDLSGLSDMDIEALAHGDMSKVSDEALEHIAGQSKPDYAGPAQAGLEHFGNAASLGYLPQLQAAAEKPMAKVLDAFTGKNVSENLPDYVDRRDENIKRMNQEEKAHPYASLAGSVAGSLATSAPASAAIMEVPALKALAQAKAAKDAGLLGSTAALGARTAAAGLASGAIGAVANPGDTEGVVDPLQPKERMKDAAISSMVGVPLHLAGEGIGAAGQWASDQAKDFAEKKAFKALGPYQRNVLQNSEDINDIGRSVLDNGVIGKMPKNYETLADRAEAAKAAAGGKIESIVDQLSSQKRAPQLSRGDIADNLRENLISSDKVPGVAKRNQYFEKLIDEFEGGGRDKIPLTGARDLKSLVGKQIKWDRLPGAEIPADEQFYRALYGALKGGEEDIASKLASSGKIPNGDAFLNAKQDYGNLAEAQKIAQTRADKEMANHFLGLRDTIAGGTGAAIGAYLGDKYGGHEGAKVGGALGGGIGGLGSKFARTYGNQVLASGGDAISRLLSNSPDLAAAISRNPTLTPMLMDSLEKKQVTPPESVISDPKFLGKFRQNPELIDQLSNESLKRSIKNALQNPERNPANQIPMPLDQAREQFRQGN